MTQSVGYHLSEGGRAPRVPAFSSLLFVFLFSSCRGLLLQRGALAPLPRHSVNISFVLDMVSPIAVSALVAAQTSIYGLNAL